MLSILATATLLSPHAMTVPTSGTTGITDTTNTLAPSEICVTFYEHIDFEGHDEELCAPPGMCEYLPRKWWARVSGIVPAEDASSCTFFRGSDCTDGSLKDVKNPGIGYLGNEWNDAIWSWICY